MARPRHRGPALGVNTDIERREIIDWYREALAVTPPPSYGRWEPVRIGPTWQTDSQGAWVLPEHSAGWEVLAWCGMHLRANDGKPWKFTLEQARFLLHFQAMNADGSMKHLSAVLQRLKGWGKDPLAAAFALSMMLGPSIFDGWGDDGLPKLVHNPVAWVQIFAVSQEQTKNTMKLFPQLLTPETRLKYGVQVGRHNVWALGDSVQIEASTSSVNAIEGNRPSLVIRNESQNWKASNQGHDLAGAIDGNISKAEKDRPSRLLDICNAYREGEDSVAQREREGWEETQATVEDGVVVGPKRADYGLLYDSLEAPPDAPLNAEAAVDVVNAVRGDATWLDVEGMVLKSILKATNTPSESRRKWYNQIQADEDAWTTAQEFDPLADLETVVEPGEQVCLFFDASKSDDATVLVGCRLLDGHRFVIGVWQRPPGKRGEGWVVPRFDVDRVVRETFDRFRVVGFFGDPSHVLEDETMNRMWDNLFDEWHRDFKKDLLVWAREGKNAHSVMFDMALLEVQRRFVEQVAITRQEMIDRDFTHDGDARLRRHVLAAKNMPTKAGMSIGKSHRESLKKIDLAIGFVGVGLVRRLVLNKMKKRGGGRVW